ncbi:citrate-binding protein [Vigna radiata var. radiata]|uniref:Citrate-binding protein n=1 Tax=Vigna radiata var. radiata TaxID=3916 RepID=A0A1S3VYI1_VIGRR|nr:citrate-binding protein [Vigna radiata var. radiata]
MVYQSIFHQTFLSFLLCITTLSLVASDPTDGFTRLQLSSSNFQVQRPYDVPQDQRYTFSNGVHRFIVYNTDKPHTSTSQTKPRTEIRITGYDYTSGVWQFEGYFYVPSGTTGVCIQQVFGGATHATTSQSRVYSGSLTHYLSPTLEQNIYNKWYRFNVIHDVGANNVKIFINGVQKFNGNGRGAGLHYFKFGVYAQDGASYRMESQWRDIKLFRRY